MQTKHLCVLIHIWTKDEVGAPLNQFMPSSKIFYWPFQGGAFLWIIYVISILFCYAFMHVCLLMPCGHLLGKGWPLDSRLLCLIVTLPLSHWYPGSGVVLDCIASWSLPSFLLCKGTHSASCRNRDILEETTLQILSIWVFQFKFSSIWSPDSFWLIGYRPCLCFFRLKDLSIDEMVGAWCFGCLSGPPGFTCWISFAPVFSLIYCWVLILALSPCYILIYMF